MKLADIRKTYQRSELLESELARDPIEQLRGWLAEAETSEVDEFNAMTLSTVAADGRPSSRIVLIKGLDHGLIWYTNYRSRKGMELAVHPFRLPAVPLDCAGAPGTHRRQSRENQRSVVR